YQNEGGPGIRDIVDLLKVYSSSPSEDVDTFIDSITYNWLVGGTDAHAKNYGLLIGSGGRVRLAPLYDVASILPYPNIRIEKVKLSMKLGGEYRLRNITLHHWRRLAQELRLDPDLLIARARDLSQQVADQVPDIRRRMIKGGLAHPIIPRLAD